jgi:hypothetical protein
MGGVGNVSEDKRTIQEFSSVGLNRFLRQPKQPLKREYTTGNIGSALD